MRPKPLLCFARSILGLSALLVSLGQGVQAAPEVLAEDLNEAIVTLPLRVSLHDGSLVSGDMLLTVFKPAGLGPFPIAIVNHGRGMDHSSPQRFRMTGMASYLVRRGFAVFVPTRLGYGQSIAYADMHPGKPQDPEDSGDCRDKDYLSAFGVAAQQIAAAVAYARQQNYVDASHLLVVGQSMGGAATVAYAADNPAGLMAYINFAGGVGGDPINHPGVPCQPERLMRAFAKYGKTTRAPSLWIYTENDQYFAPVYSRNWYRAFVAGGSSSQFIMHASFGKDGHRLMDEGLPLWRPLLDTFLANFGVSAPPPPKSPLASNYAAIEQVDRLPWRNSESRTHGYARFLAAPSPRAFAISQAGNWGLSYGQEDPVKLALAYCNRNSPEPCVLYAVDDAVVWRAAPLSMQSAPIAEPMTNRPNDDRN